MSDLPIPSFPRATPEIGEILARPREPLARNGLKASRNDLLSGCSRGKIIFRFLASQLWLTNGFAQPGGRALVLPS
jgi:hypothetical protein